LRAFQPRIKKHLQNLKIKKVKIFTVKWMGQATMQFKPTCHNLPRSWANASSKKKKKELSFTTITRPNSYCSQRTPSPGTTSNWWKWQLHKSKSPYFQNILGKWDKF
jgi:hypothetical protein